MTGRCGSLWRRCGLLSSVMALQLAFAPATAARASDEKIPVPIESILEQKCLDCHGEEAPEGGLSLTGLAAVMVGGDSGPSVRPGDWKGSLLWQRIESGEMPPEGEERLTAVEREQVRRWIAAGRFPSPKEIRKLQAMRQRRRAEEHWAFRPIVEPAIPEAGRWGWSTTAVDRFIEAKWNEAGLRGVGDAEPAQLVRRLYFDLTGLPPTAEQIDAFVCIADDPGAWECLVDRLLASPAFGERWGRHWLDVVRYADTVGGGANYTMNNAWRYRDYVIRSFNQDKPYDRFVLEQIAGDLLPYATPQERQEQLIATGFLAIGPKDFTDVDKVKVVADVIDEQLDTLGKALMGLAIGCARCHGHKFDPIPMEDYYALAGIFSSTRTIKEQDDSKRFSSWPDWLRIPLPTVSLSERNAMIAQARSREEELKRTRNAYKKRIEALKEQRSSGRAADELASLEQALAGIEERLERMRGIRIYYGDPIPVLIAVEDSDSPADARINIRGNPRQLGTVVPRGVIRGIGPPARPIGRDESGRLQLAEWLTDPRHPLTARVMVNRIWQHLFGRGLVSTPDNFGTRGAQPTHPELLDFLAARFIAEGYSVKKMVRRLVLSRVYRLGCTPSAPAAQVDPDNELLWRRNGRRLEAEEVRDALLAIGGRLSSRRGGPTLEHIGRFGLGNLYAIERPGLDGLRSVYLPVYRGMVFDRGAMFYTFDFCDPNLTTGKRPESLVPTQALFLMNHDLALKTAETLATRLSRWGTSDAERICRAYLVILGRRPSESEVVRSVEWISRISRRVDRQAAWSAFCQTLLCSSEFLLVE